MITQRDVDVVDALTRIAIALERIANWTPTGYYQPDPELDESDDLLYSDPSDPKASP